MKQASNLACFAIAIGGLLMASACVAIESPIPDTYAAAGQLLRIGDGRALNLRCSGSGEPVVLLEAGGNADSSSWFRVQPELARLTRVCAYDRAGYGFSDEGPLPRDVDADVADLHALIEAAAIPTPVVLVGHSLGSNIVRSYAQRYPQQLSGIVLVDPPEQGTDEGMPEEWLSEVAGMGARRDAFLNVCEAAAAAGDDETTHGCLRAPPPWMGEEVASAVRRNKSTPSYWRTLRSELASNVRLFSTPVPLDESYGSLPLLLLRATDQEDGEPDAVRRITDAKRQQTHERLLAASTRSMVIDVPNSSHDIQLDQPATVVAATQRLLERARVEPAADE
jgi:pimeloyl-ACP methyl ester carboxylesterase